MLLVYDVGNEKVVAEEERMVELEEKVVVEEGRMVELEEEDLVLLELQHHRDRHPHPPSLSLQEGGLL